VIPLMPVIDVIAVGRPLIEALAVGVVMARDIMDGSELAARSVAGVIIVFVGIMVFMMGIMVFMPVVRCMVIMGIVVLMGTERCIVIVGMDMGCCIVILVIIILGAPPGGLAAALLTNPKRAHPARTARTGVQNVRNICLSPIQRDMTIPARSVQLPLTPDPSPGGRGASVISARRWQRGGMRHRRASFSLY
jgi:hypothetical protein